MTRADHAKIRHGDPARKKLGRFADTFPLDCAKTKVLRDRANRYLATNPGGLNSHDRCIATLALLYSYSTPKLRVHGGK